MQLQLTPKTKIMITTELESIPLCNVDGKPVIELIGLLEEVVRNAKNAGFDLSNVTLHLDYVNGEPILVFATHRTETEIEYDNRKQTELETFAQDFEELLKNKLLLESGGFDEQIEQFKSEMPEEYDNLMKAYIDANNKLLYDKLKK